MNRGKTRFCETETHQVIFDGVTECSIKKPEESFPKIDRLLAEIPRHFFQVPIYDLQNAVSMWSVAGVGRRDVTVKLEMGAAYGNKLILSVKSSVVAGKTAINVLPVGGDTNPL
jgi:hypothetical protein